MGKKEKVIVECKSHWIRSVVPAAVALLFLLGTVTYLFEGKLTDALILLFPTAICSVIILVQQNANYLRMTETAIIGKVGVIRTRKMASPISKVNDIAVDSSLVGKILGYSTIRISTSASVGSEYVFKCVKNGDALQNAFLDRSQ